MPTDNDNLPTPVELDTEVTPEKIAPGDQIIDGNFVIDAHGVRRAHNGHFVAGGAPPPGSGRPSTWGHSGLSYREFKQSMVIAFHRNGGTDWLTEWGRANPSLFFKLMGRMLGDNNPLVKSLVEVNINWASPERLSYQKTGEVIEDAAVVGVPAKLPNTPWRPIDPDTTAINASVRLGAELEVKKPK